MDIWGTDQRGCNVDADCFATRIAVGLDFFEDGAEDTLCASFLDCGEDLAVRVGRGCDVDAGI